MMAISLMADEVWLFPSTRCFVTGDPEASGFYRLELPDGFRWITREAVCRYEIAREATFAHPCLLVRAMAPQGSRNRYLSPFVEGHLTGTELIPGYGTYFFPLPADLLAGRSKGDTIEIRLSNVGKQATLTIDSRELALAVYEVRVIDLAEDDFPERQEFLQQVKILEPAGGEVAEILGKSSFRAGERILDLGCGMGWTTVLLAALGGASACGVDLYDYAKPGHHNFKSELLERFARHREALRRIPCVANLANCNILAETIDRCTFISMNAEEMLWRDDSFDFVFSLNAFEHISKPDRALAEVRRVLHPGGRALLQFSPLYYSDAGSHLPMTVGLNRPWAHLLMSRDEIKEAIRCQGGVPNEVDSILDSLNGWTPKRFVKLFRHSGLRIISSAVQTGFTLEGAEASPEFAELVKRFPQEDLSTTGMFWYLEKSKKGSWF